MRDPSNIIKDELKKEPLLLELLFLPPLEKHMAPLYSDSLRLLHLAEISSRVSPVFVTDNSTFNSNRIDSLMALSLSYMWGHLSISDCLQLFFTSKSINKKIQTQDLNEACLVTRFNLSDSHSTYINIKPLQI